MLQFIVVHDSGGAPDPGAKKGASPEKNSKIPELQKGIGGFSVFKEPNDYRVGKRTVWLCANNEQVVVSRGPDELRSPAGVSDHLPLLVWVRDLLLLIGLPGELTLP